MQTITVRSDLLQLAQFIQPWRNMPKIETLYQTITDQNLPSLNSLFAAHRELTEYLPELEHYDKAREMAQALSAINTYLQYLTTGGQPISASKEPPIHYCSEVLMYIDAQPQHGRPLPMRVLRVGQWYRIQTISQDPGQWRTLEEDINYTDALTKCFMWYPPIRYPEDQSHVDHKPDA